MGCKKCDERRKAEAAAKARAAKAATDRAAAKAYADASAWHRFGWQFIHKFSMSLPQGALDEAAIGHVRRVVQLFIEILPCEDCKGHATAFLIGGDVAKLAQVTTGKQVVLLFHALHNDVNERTSKAHAPIEVLTSYADIEVRPALMGYIAAAKATPPVPLPAITALQAHVKALGL